MAMPPSSSKHSDNVLPYAWQRAIVLPVFILSLGLYLLTLAPTIVTVFDDSLEFQLVTYLLGIAHPTGYPLYTLLGWLFTNLPLGDVAYRVNLMSAVFGAVTIALVYLISLELIAGDWRPESRHRTDTRQAWLEVLAALIGALALVISPVFWSQATIAEVYTLNAALVAGLLWLLVRGTYPPSERWLMALAFLLGVSLTHHRTALLMLPAMVYFLWPQFRTWRLRTWIKLTVALAMPCLLYLYIPLRGHVGSLDGTYTNTLEGFWRHVSTGGYGVFFFENPFGAERGVGFYFSLFLDQFGPLGFAAGLVGLLVLRRYRFQVLTAIIFATYLVFNLFYRVADIEVFFIPLFLIWTIWIAVAAGWLLTGQWAGKDHGSQLRLPVTLLTVFLLIGQSLVLLRSNISELDRSNDWAVYDYGLDLMRQPLEPSAAIVGILGEVTLVRYFQETEGLRPDLLPIAADQEQERLATVARLLDEGRAVYLTRELSGAPARWSLGAIGPLILVNRQPILVPPNTSFPVGAAVTPGITLHGYDLSRPSARGGPSPVRLTLVWQATTPISRELKVSARLFDPEGQPVAQADTVPVHFAYPTTAWRAGEFISDVYDLYLPATLAPGEYTPIIILYDPGQGAAEIGRVTLSPIYLP